LRRRSFTRPEERDLVFTPFVLRGFALGAGAAAVRQVLEASPLKGTLVLAVGAGILAVVLLGLWRPRLAPRWTAELLAILSEPRAPLEWAGRRASGSDRR
jgi:hypothetical protein